MIVRWPGLFSCAPFSNLSIGTSVMSAPAGETLFGKGAWVVSTLLSGRNLADGRTRLLFTFFTRFISIDDRSPLPRDVNVPAGGRCRQCRSSDIERDSAPLLASKRYQLVGGEVDVSRRSLFADARIGSQPTAGSKIGRKQVHGRDADPNPSAGNVDNRAQSTWVRLINRVVSGIDVGLSRLGDHRVNRQELPRPGRSSGQLMTGICPGFGTGREPLDRPVARNSPAQEGSGRAIPRPLKTSPRRLIRRLLRPAVGTLHRFRQLVHHCLLAYTHLH